MENEIIKFNNIHFQQVKNTNTCEHKIHMKLENDSIRNKILNGMLRRNKDNDKELFKSLKLLK